MNKLRLYVVGRTPKAAKAFEDLKALLENDFKDQYSLEVIDILENPQLAEDDKILATPTAVKILPQPVRKVIGDLSSSEKILVGLDLKKAS